MIAISVNELKKPLTKSFIVYAVFLYFLLLPSCVTAQLHTTDSQASANIGTGKTTLRPAQEQIAQKALSLVGKPSLSFLDRNFFWDCSGTILAAFWLAGLDLKTEYGAHKGNGVNRIYEISRSNALTYDLPLPEVGDIIFWDNTYDYNENKLWDDPLTHAGIVVDVERNGTISYVHHDYRRGIVVAYMNLIYPDTRFIDTDAGQQEINSPMRMSSQRYLNPGKWLSSHLFRSFGRFNVMLAERSDT